MQFNIPAEFKNASGVYIIRNTLNDKVYVGSSVMLKRRFKTHRSKLVLGYHDNKYLQSFVSKHGVDSLRFDLAELSRPGDLEHLAELEQKYIALHNSANRERGFNLVPIVFPRVKFSSETISKQSAAAKARGVSNLQAGRLAYLVTNGGPHNKNANLVTTPCKTCGSDITTTASRKKDYCNRACYSKRVIDAETREKLSSINRGRPKSPDYLAKRSAAFAAKRTEKLGRNCEVCSVFFTPKNGCKPNQRFCSRDCFNKRVVSQETRIKHAVNMEHLHSAQARAKAYESRKTGKGWAQAPETIAKRLATMAAKASPQQLSIF